MPAPVAQVAFAALGSVSIEHIDAACRADIVKVARVESDKRIYRKLDILNHGSNYMVR